MARRITGCILAGGRGRRLGGVDKGLVALAGTPLVEHVLARLAPQVDDILINANRHLERYRALGARVVSDADDSYAGPLAGCHAALVQARHDLLVTAACDSPFIPLDLVARLAAPFSEPATEISVAVCAGRMQPVFALYDTTLAAALAAYLAAGGRKIDAWFAQRCTVEVDFEDVAADFVNINTPADLARARQRLAAAR